VVSDMSVTADCVCKRKQVAGQKLVGLCNIAMGVRGHGLRTFRAAPLGGIYEGGVGQIIRNSN
jgi:hypothetical protein